MSEARVDLAEEWIRAADARGNRAAAYLGLADLDADERKALALRLRDKPLAETTDLADLADLAGETDDATGIWPERWMALSERRPLLDVGAKVFYLDGDKQRIAVT